MYVPDATLFDYPVFDETDLCFVDEKTVESLRVLLEAIREFHIREDGLKSRCYDYTVVADDDTEKVADFSHDSMTVRVAQFKDVAFQDEKTYYKAERAVNIELKAATKMDAIEPPMGRQVENYLMALVISEGNAPAIPGYRVTTKRPEGGENKKRWYKTMRTEATRSFWLGTDRESQDMIREAAQCLSSEIQAVIDEISNEDPSLSQDHFYQHHKDWAAAADPTIYASIGKDIFVVLDRNGSVILCSVSHIFQRTFGATTMADAIKKWSAIPLLPQPNTARHIVDELIRRDHPELDMEKATTPQELEERASCMVNYGTWTNKGHSNPAAVFLTADALPGMGPTPRQRFRADHGFAETYADVGSVPNWMTLFTLGINTFTERHCDKTDVKHGFAALLPLGNYTGGNLCFPQLGLKLEYKPGACAIFRVAELEHFVENWHGYRIFALPSDSWYRGAASSSSSSSSSTAPGSAAAVAAPPPEIPQPPEKEDEDGEYDPCVEEDLDAEIPENGGWTEAQIHGSAYWDPERNRPGYFTSYSGSGSSSSSSGRQPSRITTSSSTAVFTDAGKKQRYKRRSGPDRQNPERKVGRGESADTPMRH
ncbi:hypothetical protein DL770_000475 [Monosporascus sp. CRB-9-2]|nr:hypothetical protein DL770_000475 [Monosporascus sp. CRB-9-2]